MRAVGLEAEEAAPDQVGRRQPENLVGGGVQVGEAALGVGLPDQVMRGLDEVAVAAFALDQQLDDPAFFGQRLLDARQFARGFFGERAAVGLDQAIDDFFRIPAMAAPGALGAEDALFIPAPQLLRRDAEQLRSLHDGV